MFPQLTIREGEMLPKGENKMLSVILFKFWPAFISSKKNSTSITIGLQHCKFSTINSGSIPLNRTFKTSFL